MQRTVLISQVRSHYSLSGLLFWQVYSLYMVLEHFNYKRINVWDVAPVELNGDTKNLQKRSCTLP